VSVLFDRAEQLTHRGMLAKCRQEIKVISGPFLVLNSSSLLGEASFESTIAVAGNAGRIKTLKENPSFL
jgi:hypothetical protein